MENIVDTTRGVGDPNAAYLSLEKYWKRCRAACAGQDAIKQLDAHLDVFTFSNVLLPFSPTMDDQQYAFYRAEAEWPGITREYAALLQGGLLRKRPQLELSDRFAPDVTDWLLNRFSRDNSSLAAFLDAALTEELQTGRAWVMVDYPALNNAEMLSQEQIDEIQPYPVLLEAEHVINWRVAEDPVSGAQKLSRVIVRGYEEVFPEGEFHPRVMATVWVHELDEEGFYRVIKFRKDSEEFSATVKDGKIQQDNNRAAFEEVERLENIRCRGERLRELPFWPLNGSIEPSPPMLMGIVDKEIAVYNKMSRRNHLLLGAATYTPVLCSSMDDTRFQQVVDSGLGTWLRLDPGDTITVLEPPTQALSDMSKAIEAGLSEMAKLGIRMLTPETAQSGVALDIRNAAQTSKLGALNMRVSVQITDIIRFMIWWRYGEEVASSEIKFTMSEDFNPTPTGEGWLRLATEWYQSALLPRSAWLEILKTNDMLPSGYDDIAGTQEIQEDLRLSAANSAGNFTGTVT